MQEPLLICLLALGLYVILTYTSQPFSSLLVMAFLFYRLVSRFGAMQRTYQRMALGESAFWSLRHAIESAEVDTEITTGATPPVLQNGITFDHVQFSHGSTPVLTNASLEIPFGEFVGIIGASGAGKTTIADLLCGLDQPTSGDIRLDGVSLRTINVHQWRQHIGYVPQEVFLFHDTVLRNITLGAEIPLADVDAAIRAAGATEFVARLPDGLQTTVGERGSKISGGERQRIAIARSLVRKPRILILDEITTSLDPATEAAICASLLALRGRVTILAISHQQALMEAADRVYRVEDGQTHRQR